MKQRVLYDFALSGNCHKVRLLLAFLELEYQSVYIDLVGGEQHQPPFRALNPRGQVPVLHDHGETVWDSAAILVYLAERYGAERWSTQTPVAAAHEQQWLALAADEIHHGLAAARAVLKFGRALDLAACQEVGVQALSTLEEQLTLTPWLQGEHPGLGDIACYPYVALAPEGEISLSPYPAVCAWLDRFEALPGYVSMPGSPKLA